MTPGRALAGLLALLALTACEPAAEQPDQTPPTPFANDPAQPKEPAAAAGKSQPAALPRGSGFDFYVLALSWSPSYCEAEGASANRQQCASGRPYAFVVHGLWPQFERGYPLDCPTDDPDVSNERLRTLYDIMPAAGLIRHEWRQHGACSGLSQDDYFKVLRAARRAVRIPAEYERLDRYRTVAPGSVEGAFLAANPGLPADGVAVDCDQRYLREVRICMSLELGFRACPQVDRRQCRSARVVMPPVRGG